LRAPDGADMSTCRVGLRCRENDRGDLEMAVSLRFCVFSRWLGNDSSGLVEIRETAISTSPPFPPPTGDQPALDTVSRPQAVGAETTAGSAVSSSLFGSKITPWQSPTDRNHPLPE
jgi:hypothetical protein